MAKNVFITGGSGALGHALVRRFVKSGDNVAFTYNKSEKRAKALSEETEAQLFKADLTVQKEVVNAVSKLMESFEHVDVLINNAGYTQIMPFALIEEKDWDEVIAANLKSMFLVTHEIVRSMIAKKSGVIINVGSLAAHRLLDVPVHYATAKAGVTGFTISLAKELSRYNIRVNSVVPGLLEEGVVKDWSTIDKTMDAGFNTPGPMQFLVDGNRERWPKLLEEFAEKTGKEYLQPCELMKSGKYREMQYLP